MRTTNYEPPIPPPPQFQKAQKARGNGWTTPRIEEVPMDDHYRALYRQALEEEPVAPWERSNGHDETPVSPVACTVAVEGADVASFRGNAALAPCEGFIRRARAKSSKATREIYLSQFRTLASSCGATSFQHRRKLPASPGSGRN